MGVITKDRRISLERVSKKINDVGKKYQFLNANFFSEKRLENLRRLVSQYKESQGREQRNAKNSKELEFHRNTKKKQQQRRKLKNKEQKLSKDKKIKGKQRQNNEIKNKEHKNNIIDPEKRKEQEERNGSKNEKQKNTTLKNVTTQPQQQIKNKEEKKKIVQEIKKNELNKEKEKTENESQPGTQTKTINKQGKDPIGKRNYRNKLKRKAWKERQKKKQESHKKWQLNLQKNSKRQQNDIENFRSSDGIANTHNNSNLGNSVFENKDEMKDTKKDIENPTDKNNTVFNKEDGNVVKSDNSYNDENIIKNNIETVSVNENSRLAQANPKEKSVKINERRNDLNHDIITDGKYDKSWIPNEFPYTSRLLQLSNEFNQ